MLNGAFKQSLLSLTWPQTAFSIPYSENHPQTMKILRCHITKKDRNSSFYSAKHVRCLNSGSHRKIIYLAVRTEVSNSVTNGAVLLLFHKEKDFLIVCVFVCVYICLTILCLCSLYVYVCFNLCVTNFVFE